MHIKLNKEIPTGLNSDERTQSESQVVRRQRVATVVLSAVFMSFLDVFIVNVALPSIARQFHEANLVRLSWVLNAYAIIFAALLVPAGRWADRLGRKRSFLLGLALFTGSSALCAASVSTGTLIGARMLQAGGAAQLLPAAMGLLLPEFPPEKRSVAVALFAVVGGAAAGIGGPIGGVLTQLGWHWVFLVNLPIGVVVLIAGLRVLREIRESAQTPRPDLLGAVILSAAIGCLVLLIVKGPDWHWRTGSVGSFGIAALAFILWFVARSRTHPAPVLEFAILRVRSFSISNIGALLFAIAFSSMLLCSILFQTQVWKSAPWLLGLQLAPGPLMAAAVAVPAGKLCARQGQRPVAFAGAVSFALGAAWWFWRLGVEHHFFSALLPGAILVGLGVGLNMPALSSAAIAGLPPERLSTGSAVQNMSRQIGMALGVAIVVAIAGQPAGADSMVQFRYSFVAMGVAALGSGIASLALASGNLLANKGGNSDLLGKDTRRGPALQDNLGASPKDEAVLVA